MDDNKSSFPTKPPTLTSFGPPANKSGGHKSLLITLLLLIILGGVGYFLYNKGYFNKSIVTNYETPQNELTTLNPADQTPGFPAGFPFGKEIQVLQNFTFTTDTTIQNTRQYTTAQSPQVIYRGIKDFLTKNGWAVEQVLKNGDTDEFYSFEAVKFLDRLSVNFNKTENGEWIVDVALSLQKVLKGEPIPDPVKQ